MNIAEYFEHDGYGQEACHEPWEVSRPSRTSLQVFMQLASNPHVFSYAWKGGDEELSFIQ